jgi:hypothetical protein
VIDFVMTPLSIAAVPLLIYSWYFFARIARHQQGWRTRVCVFVLVLETMCLLLVPVAYATAPPVHGDYSASMQTISEYYGRWNRVMVKVLIATFVLSFLCKGRLVATLAITSIGLASFWIMATIV